MNFIKRLHDDAKPIILDGAMGTQLFKILPDYTGCSELLNLENPEAISTVYRSYIESGADVLETNTFGASPIKLKEYNLSHKCAEINRASVALAKNAAKGKKVFVAGSIGPLGKLLEPMGEISCREAYDSFRFQADALATGGADLIIIETMNDLLEAKIALLAARDAASIPVICSMTFQDNGKTVSGTDMITGLATLSECGADAVGMNCSQGPNGVYNLFRENITNLRKLGVPLTAWSNAGLPEMINGKIKYNLSPEEFADISAKITDLGIKLIGGCCGTTPDHIKSLRKKIDSKNYARAHYIKTYNFFTSRFTSLSIEDRKGLIVIGERLNPTARKKFAEELRSGQFAFLREESKKQEAEGAHIIDINVGVPEIDEVLAMQGSLNILSNTIKTPLMIDSDNPDVLETALLSNPGVGLINSINGKKNSIANILPLIKRFGYFITALCLDDTGIHCDSKKRIKIGENLIRLLNNENISTERIFIDPLMLAESAEPGSAMETLKVIEHFAKHGVKTSLGLSNISFGLPSRKYINIAYLKLAMDKGLSAAIINPIMMNELESNPDEQKLALDFLTGKDVDAVRYINHFKKETGSASPSTEVQAHLPEKDDLKKIFNLVVDGNNDEITQSVKKALSNLQPESIMNDALLKALERVGDLYSKGEYFLPQMIASANSMKKGFAVLKPLLSKESGKKLGKIVICTVKGDVHDIGKNIVSMMLENHGFEVIDLGKDVASEVIIETVKKQKPEVLCLSSLLTTTMNEMKSISSIIKKENIAVKLLIGGAVVNENYAKSIGAHYGADAIQGVKIARDLVKN